MVFFLYKIQTCMNFSKIYIFNKKIQDVGNFPFRTFRTLLKMTAGDKISVLDKSNDHFIVNKKKDKKFVHLENEAYLIQNDFLKNKKLISISPGGFKGFYLLGTLSYIKQNYDLSNFIYSGASAGAWNSLFMCCINEENIKKDQFIIDLLVDPDLKKVKNILEVEQKMKAKILAHYNDTNFDFRRLFIGVTTIGDDYQLDTTIYNNFETLEDALDCCIASSHIPFLTGGMLNQYNGRVNFDGGFRRHPYLNITKSVLHVSPNMWEKIKEAKERGPQPEPEPPTLLQSIHSFIKHSTLLSLKNHSYTDLYKQGYNDARENRQILDDILIHGNYTTNYYYT